MQKKFLNKRSRLHLLLCGLLYTSLSFAMDQSSSALFTPCYDRCFVASSINGSPEMHSVSCCPIDSAQGLQDDLNQVHTLYNAYFGFVYMTAGAICLSYNLHKRLKGNTKAVMASLVAGVHLGYSLSLLGAQHSVDHLAFKPCSVALAVVSSVATGLWYVTA